MDSVVEPLGEAQELRVGSGFAGAISAHIAPRSAANSLLWDTLLIWQELGWARWEGDGPGAILVHLAPALWWELDARVGGGTSIPPQDLDVSRGWLQALDEIVGLSRVSIEVGCRSFLSGREFAFEVRINDAPVNLSGTTGSTPVLEADGGLVVLDPRAMRVLQTASAYNHGSNRTMHARLRALYELRRDEGSDLWPHSTLRLTQHLAAQVTHASERLSLGWTETSSRGLYSLQAAAHLEDSTTLPVRLNAVDVQDGVWRADDGSWVILPDAHRLALRSARQHQNQTVGQAGAAFDDPSAVLSPEIDTSTIDLTGYSARVLGFEPMLTSRVFNFESSGQDWLGGASGEDVFLRLVFGDQQQGADNTLVLHSAAEATDLLTRVEQKLAQTAGGAIQFQGRNILASEPLRDQLRSALRRSCSEAVEPTTSRGLPGAVIAEEDAQPLKNPTHAVPFPEQPLRSCLRPDVALQPHQTAGVGWLWTRYHQALASGEADGVLLADDMGLGKTLQALTFLALTTAAPPDERAPPPSLIVVPLALLENWRQEMHRWFAPELFESTFILHGPDAKALFDAQGAPRPEMLVRHRWILTTYDTLARLQRGLLKVEWNCVVFDEAHRLKNPDTLASRAARGARFRFALAMTGTPIENKLTDLWSLLDVVTHGRFGNRSRFTEEFLTEPASEGTQKLKATLGYAPSKTEPSQRLVRREKTDLKLPPKQERLHHVPLNSLQLEQQAFIRRATQDDAKAMVILAALQRLDALYQHPHLLTGSAEELKSSALPPTERLIEESPKLRTLLSLLTEVRERREKALIFTRLTAMQAILAKVLAEAFQLQDVPVINGTVTSEGQHATRGPQAIIRRFNEVDGFHIMVLSPLAAGVGLTITAANHVFHYGRWWNPAKEDQATDRCHRIGQTRPVQVNVLVAHEPHAQERGFDANLHALLARKRALARDVLEPSESMNPSQSELAELLR